MLPHMSSLGAKVLSRNLIVDAEQEILHGAGSCARPPKGIWRRSCEMGRAAAHCRRGEGDCTARLLDFWRFYNGIVSIVSAAYSGKPRQKQWHERLRTHLVEALLHLAEAGIVAVHQASISLHLKASRHA